MGMALGTPVSLRAKRSNLVVIYSFSNYLRFGFPSFHPKFHLSDQDGKRCKFVLTAPISNATQRRELAMA
jgi:hypothetical protein